MMTRRLLTTEPSVHHAIHLAALRKSCAAAPLKLLRQYKQLLLTAPGPTGAAPKAAAPTTAPKASGSSSGQRSSAPKTDDGEMLTKFDNLESLTAEDAAHSGDAAEGAATGGGWSGMFSSNSKSKAAKFQVV